LHEDATTIAPDAICAGEIEHPVRLQARAELHEGSRLGAFGFLNVGAVVYRRVAIGRYLSCGRGAEIGLAPHPTHALSTHGFAVDSGWFERVPGYGISEHGQTMPEKPITTIGHDVWIGAQAVIRAGVTIGTGAIIGANAAVTNDIEPYQIVGGVPAREIRYRFDPPTIAALLESRWWERPFDEIRRLPIHDIAATIEGLTRSAAGADAPTD